MDYLNPNSLIQGQGIFMEPGFGEGVDSGILRQLQAENQMRQANAGNLLEQAKQRSALPAEFARNDLSALRDKLLASPEMMQLFGEQFKGGANKAFAEGELARAGLPQQIKNRELQLNQQGILNQQTLQELDALAKSNPELAGVVQTAKAIAPHVLGGGQGGGGMKNPGLMGDPVQLFNYLRQTTSTEPTGTAAKMARLLAQADEKTQSTLLGKDADSAKEITKDILSGQYHTQQAQIHASAQGKNDIMQAVQMAKSFSETARKTEADAQKAIKDLQTQRGDLIADASVRQQLKGDPTFSKMSKKDQDAAVAKEIKDRTKFLDDRVKELKDQALKARTTSEHYEDIVNKHFKVPGAGTTTSASVSASGQAGGGLEAAIMQELQRRQQGK